MSSARRIANFPLVAAVSRSEDSVLRDWTKTAWLLSIVSTLSALLVAAVSLIMARRWRAQAAFLARLAESEALARQQSMQFETTLANLPQGLCMFDRDMRIAVANTQYSRLYDLAPEDIPVGTTMAEVIERRIARGVYAEGDPDEYRRSELTARDSGGALRRLTNGRMIAVNRFAMPDGGWISQHEDVTEAHGAMERISFLARQDSLTHLFNRAQLIEKMTDFLGLVRRGAATGFCVFLLDLDMFKGVNDTLGHGAGDQLLKQVGQRLRRATRDVDVAARLGGDEFAILFILDETSKRKDAESLATRLLAVIGEPYVIDAHHVVIGTSIGIATAPEDGLRIDDLMLKADLALYKAKAAGRNSFRFYDAMLENEARLRNTLQLDLHAALAEEQFELFYQPIVCAATQRMVCAEALIRWRHPRDGLISPDSFIPIAEATGMIVPIGAWVIRRAALDALDWPAHVNVAVNISPMQFRKGDLVETIARVLAETGFPARRLDVEITENVFMKDSSENLAIIQRLKQLGLSISLDDFGTGYSSLAYVRAFPLDKIKIDKSFVAEALQSRDCAAIIATIVHLARSLNISTVAEGVETQDQHQFLRAAGCTYFQGYYFGRPMSVDQLKLRLDEEARVQIPAYQS
jgi:diguanylate cyclase (GGDEF)-like protein